MGVSSKTCLSKLGLWFLIIQITFGNESPECTIAWKNLGNCVPESGKIENCRQNPKSNGTKCLERLNELGKGCEDPLLENTMKHMIDIHYLSDKLMCDKQVQSEMERSTRCKSRQLALIVNQFASIHQPYFNERGCTKLIVESRNLCGNVSSFLNPLIQSSSCNKVSIPNVHLNEDNLSICGGSKYTECFYNYGQLFPSCSSKNILLQDCLVSADKYKCPLYSLENLKQGILQRYEKSTDFACKNENIRETFSNEVCWKANFEDNIITQALSQNMLTSEGCRIARILREKDKRPYHEECGNSIQSLYDILTKDFPCSSSQSIFLHPIGLLSSFAAFFFTIAQILHF